MKFHFDIDVDQTKYAIGLMSGTSVDGIDAALVGISGSWTDTHVSQLSFLTIPFDDEIRNRILALAGGGQTSMKEVCEINWLIGELEADACEAVIFDAGLTKEDVAFIGCHGQTFWHEPEPVEYCGRRISSTLQLGEAAPVAERIGCPVVSDFRVRDMAAGGQGAPLVPYSEYILYRDADHTTGLQNIGGIGNISILPAGGGVEDTLAFDTGPGNMLIDGACMQLSGGHLHFDDQGSIASKGHVSTELLRFIQDKDDYPQKKPPKTSGRERYGEVILESVLRHVGKLGISMEDTIATLTWYTAWTIAYSVENYCTGNNRPERIIVGGGGAQNLCLMDDIRRQLPDVSILTNEDLGYSSDAKEAIAFAMLANECIYGHVNTVAHVTGAVHPVVMGKITQ